MARGAAVNDVVLRRGELREVGPKIGDGGQANVFTLPRMRLPDCPGALVYKEYKHVEGQRVAPGGLRSLVTMRNRLDPAQRAKLDDRTAWPLRVVEEDGAAVGVVLQLIPETYFQVRTLPGTGRSSRDPREVQNLFIPPPTARRLGMPAPTLEQRLIICRDFAAAVHLVHRHELVVGDLNARNALFRLSGRPAVMLVDCDATRKRGSAPAVPQLNAPDWDPPEGPTNLTQLTDRYKFGLFVLRCLVPGSLASVGRNPARADALMDPAGRRLLRAALAADPGSRPTLRDWGVYLNARIDGRPVRRAPTPPPPPPRPTGGLRRDATGQWRRVP